MAHNADETVPDERGLWFLALCQRETLMTQFKPGPGDDYPPTRPGFRTALVIVAVIVAGLGIMSWSQISAHIHIASIETSLGL